MLKGGRMKKVLALTLCLIAVLAAASCGGGNASEKKETQSETANNQTSVAMGSDYDCKYFSMKIAQGWEAGPETYGMVNVLPKGQVSPGLYFKFEPNSLGTAEQSIENMIKDYKGSPMKNVVIAGAQFAATTYTYNNSPQTMYVAYYNGAKVTITIEGERAQDIPVFKAMLDTLELK